MPAAAWKKPGVVMPFLGVVVAGVLTFGGTVVTVFDDPPPVVDCAEARRDVIEVFDKHPESVVPFNDPVLEERCRINDFCEVSSRPPPRLNRRLESHNQDHKTRGLRRHAAQNDDSLAIERRCVVARHNADGLLVEVGVSLVKQLDRRCKVAGDGDLREVCEHDAALVRAGRRRWWGCGW